MAPCVDAGSSPLWHLGRGDWRRQSEPARASSLARTQRQRRCAQRARSAISPGPARRCLSSRPLPTLWRGPHQRRLRTRPQNNSPCQRRGSRRRLHQLLPLAGPAHAAPEPTNHAELPPLTKHHITLPTPGRHRTIPRKGPGIAGFLVRVHCVEGLCPMQRIEHRADLALAHVQSLTERSQCGAQLNQRRSQHLPVARRNVLQLPVAGLDHIQRQDAAARRGGEQRCVVRNAQIAFEPDQGRGRRHRRSLARTASGGREARLAACAALRHCVR